jgi:hypothetical protein
MIKIYVAQYCSVIEERAVLRHRIHRTGAPLLGRLSGGEWLFGDGFLQSQTALF